MLRSHVSPQGFPRLIPRAAACRSVARVRIIPGEVVRAKFNPAGPREWMRDAWAFGWAIWGGALYLLFRSDVWSDRVDSLEKTTAYLVAAAVPLAVTALLYATRRLWGRLFLATAGAVGAPAVGLYVGPGAYGVWIPITVAAVSIIAVVLTEVDRRLRAVRFTTLRVIVPAGMWGRDTYTAHYEAIQDIDAEQGPAGRLFGHGRLHLHLRKVKRHEAATIVLPAMRRFNRVRDLLTLLIREATASAYMRDSEKIPQRVAESLAGLGWQVLARRR